MDGWSFRVGEIKWTGEEPTSVTPALLPAVMRGGWRQQGRVPSPQGGGTVMVPRVSVGQNWAAFIVFLGCCKSPLSLGWSLLWRVTVDRRFRGQETLKSRHHRELAAFAQLRKPLDAVCWKLEQYLCGKMTLFWSVSSILYLSISYQIENYYWGKRATSLMWCT